MCIFWRKHGTCFNVLGTSSATKKTRWQSEILLDTKWRPIYVFWGLKMAIITILGPILLIFDLERSGFHQMMQKWYINELQLSNHEYKITVFPILWKTAKILWFFLSFSILKWLIIFFYKKMGYSCRSIRVSKNCPNVSAIIWCKFQTCIFSRFFLKKC